MGLVTPVAPARCLWARMSRWRFHCGAKCDGSAECQSLLGIQVTGRHSLVEAVQCRATAASCLVQSTYLRASCIVRMRAIIG